MANPYAAPKKGDSILVVQRFQRQAFKFVQITKVGRLHIHLGLLQIPLKDLVEQGRHQGQNEDFWISQILYDTHRINKILLNKLENRMAALVPHTMKTEDIVAAARLLGVDLDTNS